MIGWLLSALFIRTPVTSLTSTGFKIWQKFKKFYKLSLDFDFLQCYSKCKKKGLTYGINNH